MIDYAKISDIIQYSQKKYFPFNQEATLTSSKKFTSKIYDFGKILFNHSPINTIYGDNGWTNPFYGTRRWEYPWIFEQLQNLVKNAKVIDCGCGVSKFPGWLADQGFDVSGLDFFVENPNRIPGYGITKSHRKKFSKHVTFFDGSMFDIPIADNTYDAAFCASVMEHIVKKDDATFHLKTLSEMQRIIKPGGVLICTYDTILNQNVFYANIANWGKDGWYYLNDIEYLLKNGMRLKEPECKKYTREMINRDEDTFFIPPQLYFSFGYGSGFEEFGKYHRLTSVGFALVKE